MEFSYLGWLKSYKNIGMKFRTKAKTDFQKDFFKLVNTSVFGKSMENVTKNRDIRLVATDRRMSCVVLDPMDVTTKWYSKKLLVLGMNKTEVKMNKLVK